MNRVLAVYSSVTTASRLKRLLEREGFTADIIQVPRCLSVNGCTHGIRIDRMAIPRLLELTEALQVRVKGIYEQANTQDGCNYRLIR